MTMTTKIFPVTAYDVSAGLSDAEILEQFSVEAYDLAPKASGNETTDKHPYEGLS